MTTTKGNVTLKVMNSIPTEQYHMHFPLTKEEVTLINYPQHTSNATETMNPKSTPKNIKDNKHTSDS